MMCHPSALAEGGVKDTSLLAWWTGRLPLHCLYECLRPEDISHFPYVRTSPGTAAHVNEHHIAIGASVFVTCQAWCWHVWICTSTCFRRENTPACPGDVPVWSPRVGLHLRHVAVSSAHVCLRVQLRGLLILFIAGSKMGREPLNKS